MFESDISQPQSASDDHREPRTPVSYVLDLGSPVPSLVGSTPPYPHLQLPRPNSTRPEHVHEGGQDSGNRRWNSRSSAGSSRNNVETTVHSMTNASTSPPTGCHSRVDPRPKFSARNRCSMLSFASTAPSLQLQTPGLQQDAFPFPQSSLGVSVEENDEDGTDDEYEGSRSGRFTLPGGSKDTKPARAGGTMVSERRRHFEAQEQVVTLDNHEALLKPREESRSTTDSTIRWETATEPSTGFSTPSTTVNQETTEHPTRGSLRSSVAAENRDFKNHPVLEPAQVIGLGLEGLTGPSGSGGSWKDEMAALECSIAEAAGSYLKPSSPIHRESLDTHLSSENSDSLVLAAEYLLHASSTKSKPDYVDYSTLGTKPPVSASVLSKMLTTSPKPSQHDAPTPAAISPPKTPTRVSSSKRSAATRPLNLSRSGSPCQPSVKSSISPSQSILNLSQKRLTSARRQQWEATSTSDTAPVSPLRFNRRSGSVAPASRTPTRQSSLLRNLQEVTGDLNRDNSVLGRQSVFSGGSSRMSTVKQFDHHRMAGLDVLSANDQENVDPQQRVADLLSVADGSQIDNSPVDAGVIAQSNSKTRRKPAPPLTSSPPSRLIRSASQAPTTQSYAMADAISTGSVSSESPSTVERMRITLAAGATTPAQPAGRLRGAIEGNSSPTDVQSTDPTPQEAPCNLSTISQYPNSGSTILASYPEVKKMNDLHSGKDTPGTTTEHYRLPSESAVFMTSIPRGLSRLSEPTEVEQPGKPLSVRNPDVRDEADIADSPSFQPGLDDASYFNYATGIGISAMPVLQEQPTFALAKRYSDSSAPFTLANGYAIPTSPDLGEQTSRGFVDKVYSKSPLSKSPGRDIMRKMVGAAKKAVNTGMKGRTGNMNRLVQGDRLVAPGTLPKQTINLNDTSTISLVPSAVQRQEAKELQPHWGQENYLRQGGNGQTNPTQGLPVELPPLPKERELPVRFRSQLERVYMLISPLSRYPREDIFRPQRSTRTALSWLTQATWPMTGS